MILAAVAHPADQDKTATHLPPCYDLIRRAHPGGSRKVNAVTAVFPCLATKMNRVCWFLLYARKEFQCIFTGAYD